MEHRIIEQQENQEGYYFDPIFDQRIEKEDFTLKENDNFRNSFIFGIKNILYRRNILKYGIMIGELSVPIEKPKGNVMMISVINRSQIEKRIRSIKEEDRPNNSVYSYIYYSNNSEKNIYERN